MAEVISVSALNRYVKMRLDADDVLFDLALRGEIANFVQNARSDPAGRSLQREGRDVPLGCCPACVPPPGGDAGRGALPCNAV